ncbi:MAG: hypothetical protein ACM35G_06840 [Planctomycetaceae bacterium]
MDATLELTHQRVDDVPLLLGFLSNLRLPEILDRHLPPHPLHQGLSYGWLITVWIAYILSRADHRKSPVQAWAQNLQLTLETLVGQPIRPVEGGSGLTMTPEGLVLGGATPPSSSPPQGPGPDPGPREHK